MGDDFMDYMLLLDDEEEDDEPMRARRSGCGCLPSVLICLAVLAAVWVLGR